MISTDCFLFIAFYDKLVAFFILHSPSVQSMHISWVHEPQLHFIHSSNSAVQCSNVKWAIRL